MSSNEKNAIVFLMVGLAWVFFFVPNPWLSFFEVQGHERFPRAVFFCLPAVLAAVLMFVTDGGLGARAGRAICLPLLTVIFWPIVSISGVYSNEGMMAFPFAIIAFVPLYLVSLGVVALIGRFGSRVTLHNIAVVAVAVVLSFVLLWANFQWVPVDTMPVIKLVLAPSLLGLLAGALLEGKLLTKLALLALLPALHVVGEGDAAKPGLEYVLALVETIFLWLGCLVSQLAHRVAAALVAENARGLTQEASTRGSKRR